MVIIGLVGPLCSGKETFTMQLKDLKNFRVVKLDQGQLQRNSGDEEKKLKIDPLDDHVNHILDGWNINTIVYPLLFEEQVEKLAKRSYFSLIYLDAPILIRYKRYKIKNKVDMSLEDFIKMDDQNNIDNTEIHRLRNISKIILHNRGNSVMSVKVLISENTALIERPFRPNSQIYFMKIAYIAKSRSNCMKKSVGAVLVDKYNRIVSTSYNGTPKGVANCNEGGCEVCNDSSTFELELENCVCIHAEEGILQILKQGCILEAGITKARGGSLYATLFPCVWCCKALVQAGIEWIYYDEHGKWDLSLQFLGDLVRIKQIKVADFVF